MARSRVARTLAACGALGSMTPSGHAGDFALSAGASVFVVFGEGGLHPGIGLDVRGAWLGSGDDYCSGTRNAGFGLYAQAAWMFDAGRFGLGVHGGGELDDSAAAIALDVELGWTYRTGTPDLPAGHGLMFGVLGHSMMVEAFGRTTLTFADPGLSVEGILGAGLRYPGPFQSDIGGCAIEGRRLIVAGSMRRPGLRVLGGHARHHRLSDEVRAALGLAWLEDARSEAASVPAFEILASDLRRLSAPGRLIDAARTAARDEVRHTRVASELAARHLGVRISPARLPSCRPEPAGFERLAIESWRDGCLGEGAAAERAARASGSTTDPDTRMALGLIASDEARHAELAWETLRFALDMRPELRHALAHDIERPMPPSDHTHNTAKQAHADPAWQEHGRLLPPERDDAWEATERRARRRLRSLIDQRSQTTAPLRG